MTYAQPYDGVIGTLRDCDDLLSLDDPALARRRIITTIGYHLWSSNLHTMSKLYPRMSDPRVGDLVMEVTSLGRQDSTGRGFGILLAHREEWAQTDEQYVEYLVENPEMRGEPRWHGDAWYVQYGPQPDDICRWENCRFIALPTEIGWDRT